MHSANQIISFNFALTIYDEFDDNAMVATYAVSMSMCYCKFVLATVSHNYSDILAQSKSTTRCAIRTPLLPIRSNTQRNDGFDVVSATSTKANSKCFLIRVVRLVAMTYTLSMIFTKFGVPKSVSARRLLGLDRFT